MSGNDVLSQDEIDALLHGVDSGAVPTEPESRPGEAHSYDFTNQVRIVRGRLPTLEMVNERFARLFRTSLFNLLRRGPEVAVAPIKMLKFSEYVHTRSEERRVGKECRSRWSPDYEKNNERTQ